MKFFWVSHITVKAPSSVMGSVSSKPTVCNVKSSHGPPGKVLVSRVYKSASVMLFESHVYKQPAKLENQRTADAKQSLWVWRFQKRCNNSELYFTHSSKWSCEDMETALGRRHFEVEELFFSKYICIHGLWGMFPTGGLTFLIPVWLFWHLSIIITETEEALLKVKSGHLHLTQWYIYKCS